MLLDTSFLMVFASKPVRCLEILQNLGKVDFIVLDAVLNELKGIASKAGVKRSNAARMALEFIYNLPVKIEKSKREGVDDAIIMYASQHKCYVATLDTDLRKRLKDHNVCVVTLVRDKVMIE